MKLYWNAQGKGTTLRRLFLLTISNRSDGSTGQAGNKSHVVVVWKKMLPKGNGTIGRCGLDGVGVVSLEEVCHCRSGL